MTTAAPPDTAPQPTADLPSWKRVGVLFHLAALSATVFVITIFIFVAVMFSNPLSPVVQWFDRNGTRVMLWEVTAVLVLSLGAMLVDRFRILRELKATAQTTEPSREPVNRRSTLRVFQEPTESDQA